MNKHTQTVIIVAGGKGERMNADIPKQFIELKGRPVLMHTIEKFFNFNHEIQIILVLPESQFGFWEALCKKHAFRITHEIAKGGATRFHSVKNGLGLATHSSLIAIHDGVRPLVNSETISACFAQAQEKGAAIPVIDLVDSLRELSGGESKTVNRSSYKLVQTPQVFTAELIKKAYKQAFSEIFTDDASVVEAFGYEVSLVGGNRENIKITTQSDLLLAEAILQSEQNTP